MVDLNRNDYTQKLFDEFAVKVSVPRFAATIKGEAGSFFVATNDTSFFIELCEKCKGEKIEVYNTLYYGYSAFVSNEQLNLGEQINNAVFFESKLWDRSKSENTHAIILGENANSFVPAIETMLELHNTRAGKAFSTLSSDSGKDGILSCKLSLNNKDAFNARVIIFGDKNIDSVRNNIFSAINESSEEAEA